jgi:hypothetical protein
MFFNLANCIFDKISAAAKGKQKKPSVCELENGLSEVVFVDRPI